MGRSDNALGRRRNPEGERPLIPLWRWYGAFLQTPLGQGFLDRGKVIGAAAARVIRPRVDVEVPWEPFVKRLSEAKVALVSTAGLYLPSDPPFDVDAPLGDPSFRVIPGDTVLGDLRIAHTHYGHQRADEDRNVVFPLERLRELVGDRLVGGLGPHAYSFGFTVQTKELTDPRTGTAHELARRIHSDGVDAAIFSPA